jgi:hypothetical protein
MQMHLNEADQRYDYFEDENGINILSKRIMPSDATNNNMLQLRQNLIQLHITLSKKK